MKIGIRAHDFGKLPLENLIEKINDKGFSAVQLAPHKAIEGIVFNPGTLTETDITHIGEVFRKNNINISVLGCYINLIEKDKEEKKKILNKFKEYIKFAGNLGCSLVGTETGSLNKDLSYNIGNNSEEVFNEVLENINELVKEAEKYGVDVGIEGVVRHTINSPEKIRRLLDRINSDNIKIIFDPVNLIDINNYKTQDEIIKECINLFGDKIEVVHAKDFIVEDNAIRIVPPGKGILNYELLIRELKIKKPHITILIEDINETYMNESKRFLENLIAF